MTTGTRTQVADTLRSGNPRILRDSLRTLSSSLDQPPSLSDPAHGTVVDVSLAEPADPQVARRVLGQFPLPFRLVDEAGRPAQAQAPNPSPLEKK